MNRLINKAEKSYITKKHADKYTKSEIELAKAWVHGKIGISGVNKAMGFKSGAHAYVFIARVWAFVEKEKKRKRKIN